VAATIGVNVMNHQNKQKIVRYLGIRFLMILCVCVLANQVHASWSQEEIKRMVVNEAERQSFPAPIALAVAEVESDFNPYARSHVDARGVMQILPRTAELDLGVNPASLYNPRVNIRAGVKFLKHLVSTYDGRVDIALSHYNGGSRVRKPDGSLHVMAATKNYVDKVLSKADLYRANARGRYAKQSTNYNVLSAPVRHMKNEALSDSEYGDPLKLKKTAFVFNPEVQEVAMSKKQVLINKLNQLVLYNQNRVLRTAVNENLATERSTNDIADKQYHSKAAMRRALVKQWETL